MKTEITFHLTKLYIVEREQHDPILAYQHNGHWFDAQHNKLIAGVMSRTIDTGATVKVPSYDEAIIQVQQLIGMCGSLILIGLMILFVSKIW